MRLNQLISQLSQLQQRVGGEARVYVSVEGSWLEMLEIADLDDNKDLLSEYGFTKDALAVIIMTESIANLGYEVVAIDDTEIEYGYDEDVNPGQE